MGNIKTIKALEVLDSRGIPTIEVILTSDNGTVGKAMVPSGASTGEHEALELRDKDLTRYHGKGVLKAIKNVEGPLQEALIGSSIFDQEACDKVMIDADGTENKSKFGANAILGISLAIARCGAHEKKIPLYKYLSDKGSVLPCPMMNIINGGAHGDNLLEIQEFMIRPIAAPSFKESVRWGSEVFHCLKKILKEKGYSTSVGDEGGFAPNLQSHEEALSLIIQAIEMAKYKPGEQISIALDVAASEFFDKEASRYIEKKKKNKKEKYISRTSDEQIEYIKELCKKYPIDSVEDGMDENDWIGMERLTKQMGDKIQIVGDDMFVTNTRFLKRAIKEKAGNAILIKLNQIGTLTETLQAIKMAQENNFKVVISHRSGETEDSFIADLSVATNAGQIKTGSLSRSERMAKYNRLIEIEEDLLF